MTQPLSTFTAPLPELKTAQLTHGRLTYRETGEGKKRQNLLFLHGLLGNAKSWSYQFQDRSLGQNYRLMAWDAPGFGGSDLVEAHIDAYLAALAEFVDHVAEGPIFLVGHSMGGTLAARYAARYPEQVRRLVLSCTHPGYAEPETAPKKAQTITSTIAESTEDGINWTITFTATAEKSPFQDEDNECLVNNLPDLYGCYGDVLGCFLKAYGTAQSTFPRIWDPMQ